MVGFIFFSSRFCPYRRFSIHGVCMCVFLNKRIKNSFPRLLLVFIHLMGTIASAMSTYRFSLLRLFCLVVIQYVIIPFSSNGFFSCFVCKCIVWIAVFRYIYYTTVVVIVVVCTAINVFTNFIFVSLFYLLICGRYSILYWFNILFSFICWLSRSLSL